MSIAQEFNPVGASYDEVYAQLKRARAEAPVFFSEPLQCWVVTRYDDIMEVLGDNENFTVEDILSGFNYSEEASRILSEGVNWNETKHVTVVDGDEHTRLRSIIQKVLSPKRFREMEPVVRGLARDLIEKFAARGECEFIEEFCYPLPILTVFRLIGFDESDEDIKKLQQWSDDTFKMWLTPMEPDEQIVCARHAVDFQNYMRAKIHDRRANPRDDVMSAMVRQMDSGEVEITEDELILIFIFNLIGAGHETTKAQIGNMMYQLLRDPARWQAFLDDPSTAEAVAEEAIRHDGSVITWYRRAAQDVTFKGFDMKKGDFVLMGFGSANHDEDKFDDPASFCPMHGKKPVSLTFSQGKHFCLGAPLARMELAVTVDELAKRLPGLRLKPGQDIVYDPAVATRSLSKLALEWDV